MSESARHTTAHDAANRSHPQTGPLRDWLAAMRATAPEAKPSRFPHATPAPVASAFDQAEERVQSWAPRHASPAQPADRPERDEDIAEIVAENLMLKARLRLEADRRDELQILLAQEIREMRAHIDAEIADLDEMRAERDLWKDRCEALMQPLFSGQR